MLVWIQGLRALAALFVAFLHMAHDAAGGGGDPRHWLKTLLAWFPFDAGVDIFFVISGFVIIRAAARLFGQPGGALTFLRHRLARIVPLYWLMTTAFLATLLANRAAIHGDIGGPQFIIASYLFIPWPRPDGVMQPAFGLGWTLNFEMFFYAATASCLLLERRRAVVALAVFLLLFVGIGRIWPFASPQLGYWSNPIVLEFVFGMGLALCPWQLRPRWRWMLFIAGLAALHFSVAAPAGWRPFTYGLPALTLVAAACLGAPAAAPGAAAKLMLRLGDASYAMYLVHPFIMRGLTVSWHKIHAVNETASLIYVASGLLAAQLCALGLNICFEQRVKFLFRRRD